MAQQHHNIQIEKIDITSAAPDGRLAAAFSDYEVKNIEFGLDWLKNLAQNALSTDETAAVYVARTSPDDFIACPMRLNSRSMQASSLSTFYTSLYSPIVHSDQPGALLNALFSYLARTENVTSITLYPMNAQSGLYSAIQDALQQSGWRGIHSYVCFANWTHKIVGLGGYSAYFESLPSRQRNTVKRKTRRFLHDNKGQLQIIQGEDGLDWATEAFNAVYENSWKQEEPYPAFIPNLLRIAARKGWLRLGIASYETAPVAAQVWLVSNGVAHIFKLAYDENYKGLSPGTVLTAHMMEQVIDVDNVSLIDYLTGDDSYKEDWMSTRTERRGVAAYNPLTAAGLGQCVIHKLKKIVKSILNQP